MSGRSFALGPRDPAEAAGMCWFGLYVGIGLPVLLVLMGLGLMWYDA